MMRSGIALSMSALLIAQSVVVYAQKGDPAIKDGSKIVLHEKGVKDLGLTWELRPRTPIKFTPFEMVDPNTGKPVNADDIIVVNGVKMKAGDYYRQLNAMEQWLNDHGYSLRTDTVFEYYSPKLEAEIAESEQRLRELEAQMPLSGDPLDSNPNGDFMPAACTGDGRSFDTGWFGNSIFGARFYGSGSYQVCYPSPLSATVSGQAVLQGRIGGSENNIAEATATASASTSDLQNLNYSYNVSVRVLGNQVWGPSGSGTVPLRYADSWDWRIASIDWRSPTIPLGCVNVLGINICINGRAGVAGYLNLAASVDLQVLGQQANARPYGQLTGFAEAWIGFNAGIVSAEAGVRGNITFVNGNLNGSATGNFAFRGQNGRLCLDYNFNARLTANLNALSGNVQAYARGCIWFFGRRCAEGNLTLFSWNGISWNHELGSWSHTINLTCF
ncbi:MAG: hypothetical protein CFK49_00760 [Armatimonadetes bacterium JP3_11]|nr:MAG: hypothetical protein CFK49_00760 [Armatimonadetes bacterium JP3_11]RMH07332.1 MAG: hypothetical protein D6697_08655 [Armatimonadota bacterium]